MSNIEKIKVEIERLKKILEESTYYLDNFQQALGYSFALDDFKEFIDSLPEEKPSEDLEEEIAIWIPEHITGGESGVWKECREAVTEWAGIVARHFAEWQKEHSFKPTQEQLNALDNVYKTHGADSACRHILLNLLNQLKSI